MMEHASQQRLVGDRVDEPATPRQLRFSLSRNAGTFTAVSAGIGSVESAPSLPGVTNPDATR
jgi:hypothetical protein